MKEIGELALGSRLKRLSDTFMKDVQAIYNKHGVEFNPKWFPVFFHLHSYGSSSVMELSEKLGLTHPAVSQFIKELESRKLVVLETDKNDSRKRNISLSDKALKMLPKMKPLWEGMTKTVVGILSEQTNNLLFAIEEMEDALSEKSFFDRVNKNIKASQLDEVKIINFKPSYSRHFAKLNYDWIKKYFKIEKQDEISLNNPKKYIIDKGGFIIFAEYGGEIVGTVALINDGDGVYEMAKMAVDEKYQGKQIGKKLGVAIIEKAKELGAKEVFLVSNTKLVPAISLYQKLGFKKVQLNESEYERADIKMTMKF